MLSCIYTCLYTHTHTHICVLPHKSLSGPLATSWWCSLTVRLWSRYSVVSFPDLAAFIFRWSLFPLSSCGSLGYCRWTVVISLYNLPSEGWRWFVKLTSHFCSCTSESIITSLGYLALLISFKINTLDYNTSNIDPAVKGPHCSQNVGVWAEEQRQTWYRLSSLL